MTFNPKQFSTVMKTTKIPVLSKCESLDINGKQIHPLSVKAYDVGGCSLRIHYDEPEMEDVEIRFRSDGNTVQAGHLLLFLCSPIMSDRISIRESRSVGEDDDGPVENRALVTTLW